ncbi:MAG: hypothetical protein EXS64_10245 [Candidatus Latescibacteria bacterium]|nr:hypothetical protein [Candidatus Latescibacterota bacterium]
MNIALVVLRYRQPDRERPFRVPIALGRLPLLPVLGLLSTVALMFHFESQVYLAGAATVLAGLGGFAVRHIWTGGSHSKPCEGD